MDAEPTFSRAPDGQFVRAPDGQFQRGTFTGEITFDVRVAIVAMAVSTMDYELAISTLDSCDLTSIGDNQAVFGSFDASNTFSGWGSPYGPVGPLTPGITIATACGSRNSPSSSWSSGMLGQVVDYFPASTMPGEDDLGAPIRPDGAIWVIRCQCKPQKMCFGWWGETLLTPPNPGAPLIIESDLTHASSGRVLRPSAWIDVPYPPDAPTTSGPYLSQWGRANSVWANVTPATIRMINGW